MTPEEAVIIKTKLIALRKFASDVQFILLNEGTSEEKIQSVYTLAVKVWAETK